MCIVQIKRRDMPNNMLNVSDMLVDIASQDDFKRSAFMDTTPGS